MLTNEKANYQVKLILSHLPKEEYHKIPQKIINYIENNCEYDENIKIDPTIPLENQNIDKKSYQLLEKILNIVQNSENVCELENFSFIDSPNSNELDVKMTEMTWKKILNDISNEKNKNQQAKELLEEYIKLAKKKDIEIENLKKHNEELYELIKKIPKFIRKIFIKNDIIKLLNK